MKQTYDNFKRILNRSKEYEFEGHTVLVLRDYYTGDEIRLDFNKITPEMFDEIKMAPPVEEIWNICKSRIDGWEERAAYALMTMDMDRCSFERADYDLYNQVAGCMQDFLDEHDLGWADVDFEPEDVLVFNPDATE